MTTEQTLEKYILQTLLLGKKKSVGINESLISSGTLDSLTLLELIAFVEKQFEVEVREHEMVPDNFQTIAAIKAFIDSKKGSVQ
jgi:acyl carrier protein